MSDGDPHFSLHDTTFSVWTAVSEDWGLYAEVANLLRGLGFSWHQDPRVKRRYRSIARYHHHGAWAGLQFCADIAPARIGIAFYQDVVFENPHGGRYDFDRVAKMPYPIALRFRLASPRLKALLAARGFRDACRPDDPDAMARVLADRAELCRTHPEHYTEPRPYNIKDADGVAMQDGNLRYYRDRKGYLCRGYVYFSLNNVHWIVSNDRTFTKVASFECFAPRPGLARKRHSRARERLEAALAAAVRRRDFERAARMRDALGLAVEAT